jgi:hypothetical protein
MNTTGFLAMLRDADGANETKERCSLAARAVSADATASAHAARRGLANIRLLQAQALLFLLPNAIFAAWIQGVPGAILAIGCLASILLIGKIAPQGDDSSMLGAPIAGGELAICLALAVALCLLGGEAHLFYANHDWLIRDAVLSDIAHRGFPIFYRLEQQDYLLRAPLGMYLTPALVGRTLGLNAAHLALLAQNAALTATILYFVAQLAKPRKFAVLAVVVLFSGLDILPMLLKAAAIFVQTANLVIFWGLESWAPLLLQYSSHLTQLFWTPNHALPGWWFAILALLWARSEIDISLLIVSFAALLLWSPLAMMGAAPFVAYFALSRPLRNILSAPTLLAAAAAVCFVPIAIYLTVDAGAVPHRWMFGVEGFVATYFIFLAIEIPHSLVLAAAWSWIDRTDRRILALAIALLAAIPFYSIGTSNDFVMRASIVPLFLLAFAFARVASLAPRDNGALAACIAAIVIISAATPLFEIKRAFIGAYAISDCNLATSIQRWGSKEVGPNYFASAAAAPAWLQPTTSDRVLVESRRCWPDHPVLDDKRK